MSRVGCGIDRAGRDLSGTIFDFVGIVLEANRDGFYEKFSVFFAVISVFLHRTAGGGVGKSDPCNR